MEPPRCKFQGCLRSQVKLMEETEKHWTFVCMTCHGIQVVTKEGLNEMSREEMARQYAQSQASEQRRREFRTWFT
jgi:hypothetical protein